MAKEGPRRAMSPSDRCERRSTARTSRRARSVSSPWPSSTWAKRASVGQGTRHVGGGERRRRMKRRWISNRFAHAASSRLGHARATDRARLRTSAWVAARKCPGLKSPGGPPSAVRSAQARLARAASLRADQATLCVLRSSPQQGRANRVQLRSNLRRTENDRRVREGHRAGPCGPPTLRGGQGRGNHRVCVRVVIEAFVLDTTPHMHISDSIVRQAIQAGEWIPTMISGVGVYVGNVE